VVDTSEDRARSMILSAGADRLRGDGGHRHGSRTWWRTRDGRKAEAVLGQALQAVCFTTSTSVFNRPNVHLVDTRTRCRRDHRPRAGRRRCRVPVDLLIYAPVRSHHGSAHRLGFDPKGVGGVALSERWPGCAHAARVLASGFPNLLLISLVQGGFGTNFSHLLSSRKHVAHIIEACVEEGCHHRTGRGRRRGVAGGSPRVGAAGARYFQPARQLTTANSSDRCAGCPHLTYSGASSTTSLPRALACGADFAASGRGERRHGEG